jgi:polysaccharide biosynthesis transport protein
MQETQNSQDNSVSVPRRPQDVEDYIDILRRQKHWILAPLFVGLVASVIAAYMWADTYVSEAVIKVVPPQVSEKLVPTALTTELSERVNSMANNILSRTNLLNILQSNNLYPELRKKLTDEDVVEKELRKAIRVGALSSVSFRVGNSAPVSAFTVSFKYRERHLAQRVTEELASRFIDENVRLREASANQTDSFLQTQLEEAKRDLDGVEQQLAQYRMRNSGRLPEQIQGNMQQLRAYEARLAASGAAISQLNQQKLMLESELRTLRGQLDNLGSVPSEDQRESRSPELRALDNEILKTEAILAQMLERYRDTHPDVKNARSRLTALKHSREQVLERERQNQPPTPTGKVLSSEEKRLAEQIQAQMARFHTQIEGINTSLEQKDQEQKRTMEAIEALNARIQSTPMSELEYNELILARNAKRERYEGLTQKKRAAEISRDLERRKQSETLELLDKASLPLIPAEPNRLLIVGVGAVLGLFLGLGLAAFREVKNTALKNLKDVRAYTQLPVLGSVPFIEDGAIVSRKRRNIFLAWSAAFLIGTASMGASLFYYYNGH